MNSEILKKAVRLGEELEHVFVATADTAGLPHVAVAGKISLEFEDRVAVMEWFCAATVANLEANRSIGLIVWGQKADMGYQLLGACKKVEELGMMNGYSPGLEDQKPLPQVERKLIVRIDKITDLKHAPHSDLEK
jgi:hypothetical protein